MRGFRLEEGVVYKTVEIFAGKKNPRDPEAYEMPASPDRSLLLLWVEFD
jgi:hypothetical protein